MARIRPAVRAAAVSARAAFTGRAALTARAPLTARAALAARVAVAALAVAVGAAGCGVPTSTPAPSGDLTVLADSSLTEVFSAIGRDVEAAYPGLRVTFTFGASPALAEQVVGGSTADLFAAADAASMRRVTDGGFAVADPAVFTRNQLVIAVPRGNPGRVAALSDLARVRVAACAPELPCGKAAATVLAAGAVSLTPALSTPDTHTALEAVASGEVDAALVYRTEARAAESTVDTVEFVESVQAVDDYSMVPLSAGANRQAASAFIAYVTSQRGREILGRSGFPEP